MKRRDSTRVPRFIPLSRDSLSRAHSFRYRLSQHCPAPMVSNVPTSNMPSTSPKANTSIGSHRILLRAQFRSQLKPSPDDFLHSEANQLGVCRTPQPRPQKNHNAYAISNIYTIGRYEEEIGIWKVSGRSAAYNGPVILTN